MAGLRGSKKTEEKVEVLETVTPEVKEEIKAEKVEEVVVVQEEQPKAEPKVRIKPNQDLRTFIGDQWYSLKKGEVTTVPANVKEILQRAKVLEAL